MVVALGLSAVLSTPCLAAAYTYAYTYAFVNTLGSGTTIGDTVIGNIYTTAPLPNGTTYSAAAMITLESVLPHFDAGFVPTSWTGSGEFIVANHQLVGINFAANNGSYILSLDTLAANREYIFTSSYSKGYYALNNGHFQPGGFRIPDAGSTCTLLGLGFIGLGLLRRQLKSA